MGLPRSTYYDAPAVKADDAEIVVAMTAICDEFEVYGYHRVGAELRHRGTVVNSKKIRRLMREHDLQPKRRRRFDRCTRCRCGTEGGYPSKAAAEGLYPPLGSRFAIRFRALPQRTRRTWSRRLHGPTWQSL